MRQLLLCLVYLLFFFSGAAALIYEVVWVRSRSLIFGGTHLAVTTVLSALRSKYKIVNFYSATAICKQEHFTK